MAHYQANGNALITQPFPQLGLEHIEDLHDLSNSLVSITVYEVIGIFSVNLKNHRIIDLEGTHKVI